MDGFEPGTGRHWSRRRFLNWSAATMTVAAAAGLEPRAARAAETAVDAAARRVHRRLATLDTHVDTPLWLMRPEFDFGRRSRFAQNSSQIDLPRMEEGGADAMFFAVYLAQGPRTEVGFAHARDRARAIFDRIAATAEAHADRLALVRSVEELEAGLAAGRRSICLGMENGWLLGRDLGRVREYHARGARYIGLCHMENNDLCDSSTDRRGPEHGGLSPFGRQVVAEMNRLGLMVDVSHASDETVVAAAGVSRAPIIASHSSTKALCDHPRNLSDELIRVIAGTGGVVHVTLFNAYVRPVLRLPAREAALAEMRARWADTPLPSVEQAAAQHEDWLALNRAHPQPLATLAQFVDHIEHVIAVAGIDHVGIGTDFDGGGGVAGCTEVSDLPALTAELLRRGYGEDALARLWSGNTRRVWREVEAVSRRSA